MQGSTLYKGGQELSYYHRDEQLGTAFMTGGHGAIQNSYLYDAFGAEVETNEQFPNRIRYTGQQYDEFTEQYYLRERYYNPVLGRFMQEDVYQGDGLNLYAYCANNPVVYSDPSGYKKENCGSSGSTDEGVGDTEPVNNSNGQEGGSNSVPQSLLQGEENTRVYLGIKEDGTIDYVGITYDVPTRQAQHGDRFDYLLEITEQPLTRRQARAIEQTMIEANPQFSNIINSISPSRDWYKDAITWGKTWLKDHGYLK